MIDGTKRVGYWTQDASCAAQLAVQPSLLLRVASLLALAFVPPLPDPRDHVDESWNEAERERVARYADAGQVVRSWLGYSICRLCGKTIEDCTDRSDGTYTWPGGLAHYIREHKVRPPGGFVEHALLRGGW